MDLPDADALEYAHQTTCKTTEIYGEVSTQINN